jgi:RNA polymerase sigma-70 factor (ECF subfamily)
MPTPSDDPVTAPASRTGDAPSDEDIARRVLGGELELFEILMRRHNQRIYRSVRPLVRDEAEVEDVMQQAYLSAYSSLRQFQGAARFGTWLVRIAVHEALARLRRSRRQPLLEGDLALAEETRMIAAPRSDPRDLAAGQELATLLERAIDGLPAIYRQVFVLREIEGMTTAETAGALETSEDVVKTRLHRAKSMLHGHLAAVAESELGAVFAFRAPRCDRLVHAVRTWILGGRAAPAQ